MFGYVKMYRNQCNNIYELKAKVIELTLENSKLKSDNEKLNDELNWYRERKRLIQKEANLIYVFKTES